MGKAGKSRWMGRRPKVRGVAMNPVDHPHGEEKGKLQVEGVLFHFQEFYLKVNLQEVVF